jgi:hypothetical protein
MWFTNMDGIDVSSLATELLKIILVFPLSDHHRFSSDFCGPHFAQ